MSIAVHQVSNSIVVTAPETLFQDIKQLIDRLDQQSEQSVEVIYYPSSEGVEMLREALQAKGSRSRHARKLPNLLDKARNRRMLMWRRFLVAKVWLLLFALGHQNLAFGQAKHRTHQDDLGPSMGRFGCLVSAKTS